MDRSVTYAEHPLIDPESAHYYDDDGVPTIIKLEDDLSVYEMMGACRFNIWKYNN
jgi:hypothetical protein